MEVYPWDLSTIRAYANEFGQLEENPVAGAMEIANNMGIAIRILTAGQQLTREPQVLRTFTENVLRSLSDMDDRSDMDQVQGRVDAALAALTNKDGEQS